MRIEQELRSPFSLAFGSFYRRIYRYRFMGRTA